MPAKPERIEVLASKLKEISELIASEEISAVSPSKAKRVRTTIASAYEKLREVVEDLDPIKHPGSVFDPSNPSIVGRIVGITLIAQPRKPLSAIERFYGSGVYAIYYKGDFPAYRRISKREHPIYVGKADPADPAAKTAQQQSDRLSRRLADHFKSINKAKSTLSADDFEYRALVVQTGWQTSAEDFLIDLFKPIWNSEINICYGFGKHGDDPATRANLRSPWDTLHPGRDWAHRDPKMKDARQATKIVADISDHLDKNQPFKTIDEILKRFLEEIRTAT